MSFLHAAQDHILNERIRLLQFFPAIADFAKKNNKEPSSGGLHLPSTSSKPYRRNICATSLRNIKDNYLQKGKWFIRAAGK
ncbi:unnamed protein product [Nesidiocoris tenuis]|uniref:Uncharacterized protein n=1 Tax=Nesidiocoris tenuis TaxID=355587 RepID=A0A6H5HJB6_9HEMI|nr:unnamed protein product [Nesidiocoris tenuis]